MENQLDEVFRLLEKATLFERDGQRIEAATKYYEGCHLMRQMVSQLPIEDPATALLKEKIDFYTLQAQRLYFDEGSVANIPRTPATITLPNITADDVSVLTTQSSSFSEMHQKVKIGNTRLNRAIDLDETNKTSSNNSSMSMSSRSIDKNTKETIIQAYLSAAEAYLFALKLSENLSLPLSSGVRQRLEGCLDRTEALKRSSSGKLPSNEEKRKR